MNVRTKTGTQQQQEQYITKQEKKICTNKRRTKNEKALSEEGQHYSIMTPLK